MPKLHGLLSYLPAILVVLILMRVEVLLASDMGHRRIEVFHPERRLEYWLVGAIHVVHWLANGSAVTITVLIVNALGGGIIHLAGQGPWYAPSLVFYLVVFDFYSYLAHRALHKIPVLWAMHSLHHSATAMSVTTGARHFWFETFVDAVFFAPFLGLLLNVPASIGVPVVILDFLFGAITHLDAPICLGKLGLWLNNPQWHRIHHSRLPEHRDKNFANFFPVFDLIFGTAWIPRPHEFPVTGLDTGDRLHSVFEGMIWPLRHVWRRRRFLGTTTRSPAASESRLGAENGAVLEATPR